MKKIFFIGLNTFLESVRSKILYICLLFALVLISLSPLLGSMSGGEEKKIIQDMGLSAISFFGVLVAILIGTTLIFNEIEKRTIYTILSKPVERYQFFLGKYLGLSITLFVLTTLMSFFYFTFLWWQNIPIHMGLFQALCLEFFTVLLLVAFGTFFSSITTPILTMFFTGGIYMMGTTIYTIQISEKLKTVSGTLKYIYYILYYTVPNLDNFNIKGRVVHGESIPWTEFTYSLLYGSIYIAIVLVLGLVLFQKKDF